MCIKTKIPCVQWAKLQPTSSNVHCAIVEKEKEKTFKGKIIWNILISVSLSIKTSHYKMNRIVGARRYILEAYFILPNTGMRYTYVPNTKCATLFGKLSNGSKSDILMAKTREEQ